MVTRIEATVVRSITEATRHHRVGKDGPFLIAEGDNAQDFRGPGDGVKRALGHIHFREIELAILHVIEDQFSCHRTSLARTVASLFGAERLGNSDSEIINGVADSMIESGKLRLSGYSMYLGEQ